MDKFFLYFITVLFGGNVVAQSSDTINKKSTPQWQLSQVVMENGYASNHITGSMALGLGFNFSLTNETIDKTETFLTGFNRLGSISNIYISLAKANREHTISYKRLLGSSYSGDLYNLIFQGNAGFAGQTMNLNLRARQFEMLSADFQIGNWGTKLLNNKSGLKLKQSVGVHLLTKYAFANTESTNTLLTSPTGLNIAAVLNYQYQNGTSLGFRGVGAGWSAHVYKREKWKINVWKIKNLGVAYVLPGITQYQKDSQWSYSGFDINIGSGFNFRNTSDSINSLLYDQSESDGKMVLLPVELEWLHQGKNWNIGANYILLPGYLPMVHALKKGITKKQNSFAIGVQAGGWGLVNTRLEYSHFLKKEARKLQFRMVGIESLLLPYPTFQMQMSYKL